MPHAERMKHLPLTSSYCFKYTCFSSVFRKMSQFFVKYVIFQNIFSYNDNVNVSIFGTFVNLALLFFYVVIGALNDQETDLCQVLLGMETGVEFCLQVNFCRLYVASANAPARKTYLVCPRTYVRPEKHREVEISNPCLSSVTIDFYHVCYKFTIPTPFQGRIVRPIRCCFQQD